MPFDPAAKYGRLTPLPDGAVAVGPKGGVNHWVCRCDCGDERPYQTRNLTTGNSQSCGCLQRELTAAKSIKHGLSKVPEYEVWLGMRKRCKNSNRKSYKHYGGRGINVDPRWDDFETFFRDMGPRPSPLHELDRKDNDGDYTPSNCHWTLAGPQARNKRTNRNLTFNGKTQCLVAWAEETGIGRQTIEGRLERGWSVERALTEPVKENCRNKKTGQGASKQPVRELKGSEQ